MFSLQISVHFSRLQWTTSSTLVQFGRHFFYSRAPGFSLYLQTTEKSVKQTRTETCVTNNISSETHNSIYCIILFWSVLKYYNTISILPYRAASIEIDVYVNSYSECQFPRRMHLIISVALPCCDANVILMTLTRESHRLRTGTFICTTTIYIPWISHINVTSRRKKFTQRRFVV